MRLALVYRRWVQRGVNGKRISLVDGPVPILAARLVTAIFILR